MISRSLRTPRSAQDLGADAVVAQVGREAEALVGLDRVEPLLVLEPVGADLVLEPDAAPFLSHVEQHAAALGVDHLHGGLELLAAVAALGAEGVARQALAVHAHQHVPVGVDLALHQGHVVDVVDAVLVDDGAEVARVGRGHGRLGRPPHELLVAQAVLDQVGDRDDLDAVDAGELHQIRQPRHGAVVVHDLADHAGGPEPGQPRQIHGALGLPRAPQHAALAGAQRKHVARAHDVGRLAPRRRSPRGWWWRDRRPRFPVVTPWRASIDTVKAVPKPELFS